MTSKEHWEMLLKKVDELDPEVCRGALKDIITALDSQEWNSDTWQSISDIFEFIGIEFASPDDREEEDE